MIKERTLEGRRENLEEAQDLYENRKDELLLATRVKIEMALWIREEPSEEQTKQFNKRLFNITNYETH